MNLESILKFHFPKSPRLSDESRGTSPDALNTTDALTAAGMAQSRVELGYGAFLGKMELSQAEKHRAVVLLTERLRAMAKDYEYVMELNEDQRNGLIILVAVFAFRDYCQSAATEKFALSAAATGIYQIHIANTHRQFVRGATAKATLKTIANVARGAEKYRIKQPVKRRKCQYSKRASIAAGAGTRVSR